MPATTPRAEKAGTSGPEDRDSVLGRTHKSNSKSAPHGNRRLLHKAKIRAVRAFYESYWFSALERYAISGRTVTSISVPVGCMAAVLIPGAGSGQTVTEKLEVCLRGAAILFILSHGRSERHAEQDGVTKLSQRTAYRHISLSARLPIPRLSCCDRRTVVFRTPPMILCEQILIPWV
jgi:hypothetical protein